MTDIVFGVVLSAAAVGVATSWYMMLGGPKLWGPERGVPFSGHPFERAWITPRSKEWTCPDCHTTYEAADGRWVVKHD